MGTAKMETAAQKYARIKAEKDKSKELHEVVCECGMDWKCQKLDVEFFVTSGILPLGLVEVMLKANAKADGNVNNALKGLAAQDVARSIEFSAKTVRATAVEPAIKEYPTEPNDISQEMVMTCCFRRLLAWQMGGGNEAERLQTFPQS